MWDSRLSIALALGIHVDTSQALLRQRFVAAWGRTEVYGANRVSWDLTQVKAWRFEIDWSVRFAETTRFPYGLSLEATSRARYGDLRQHRRRMAVSYGDARQYRLRHHLPYGDARQHGVRFVWPYTEVPLLRMRHVSPYSGLGICQQSMRFPYWLTQAVAACHVLAYAVTNVDPVAKRFTASWSLLADQRLQAVVNTPEMVWQDRTIRIVRASLSCDEDSPVWIATVEVAQVADFAAIAIGDAISLQLGLETFDLAVDGKTLSRESQTSQQCVLTAISPLALLDAPFAASIRYYQPVAVSARAAVEDLIGGVDWQLLNWIVPAGRLLMEGVTPLAAARSVVAAIGGIIESAPDGSVVCRRRHPVSIPDYGQTEVAHQLFDADVLSSRAQIAPARGYNRVTLANEDSAGGGSDDRIEYAADPTDANQGTVRAYLAATRPVLLVHTGHPATVIAALGEVTRSESEIVEFIEGRASTRYPVTTITNAVWQHTDLGVVTADGQVLTSAVPGYSLLDLTYTTDSLDWRVALDADEEVQFMLIDV